ncbi:hypothetical protein CDV50_15985 [Haematobacter massiliensis]|uniref:hypothetical protein n=1 Tax=Haematobacter massiliensis TaxID=195105 RepID=UPI000B49E88F|nr:hypothetical protein [Haematobacter massiliensis]OWJ69820.1 hypothetical protein CDV50_15985 [Haematobacter massiliensis]
MKSWSAARLAARTTRRGLKTRLLLWIAARNRQTGAIEGIGFWNGDDHQTIAGRPYFGAENLQAVGALVSEVGLTIRYLDVSFAGVTPEVLQAARGFDLKGAAVELHRVDFDLISDELIGSPERLFRGWIDRSIINTPPVGSSGALVELSLASASRALTRTLTTKYSDASQRLRDEDDRFFADAEISAQPMWGARQTEGRRR